MARAPITIAHINYQEHSNRSQAARRVSKMQVATKSARVYVSSGRSVQQRRLVPVKAGAGQINPSIRKEEEKVADFLKASELPPKAVMCRCWRSDKFPYCNGSHVKHNKETGDNVGPLIIENPK